MKGGENLMKVKEKFDLEKSLKKIKDAELDVELLNRENEKLCHENSLEIGKLAITILREEDLLQSELKRSGEDKLECKLGSISFKVMPDSWVYNEEVLMAWIISLPARLKNMFLKVTTTIKKADLKKQIMSDNDVLFEKSKLIDYKTDNIGLFLLEGEVFDPDNSVSHKVEGIEIKHQDPKFSITIKNLKK